MLNEAAIRGKVRLSGRHERERYLRTLIPAGTRSLREFEKIIVGSREDYDRIQANRKNVIDYSEKQTAEKE